MSTVQSKPGILVTAVGAPPGLNTLRFLHASGRFRIVAADADPLATALYQYTGVGVASEVIPLATHAEKYLEALTGIIRKHNIAAVISCIEDEVRVLAANRDLLQREGADVLLPDPDVLRRANDKYLCTELAKQNGIPVPHSMLLQDKEPGELARRVQAFARECPPPWIVKPVFGHGMRGVSVATSHSEAAEAAASIHGNVIIQECVPGKVGSMYLTGILCDREGLVVRRYASRSFRTHYPSGGPATAGVTVQNTELLAMTERLLEAAGTWRGPAGVEWMLDPRDGRFKFIEVNPRIWGYSSLAAGAGALFHEWLVDLTLGRDLGPDPGYKIGVVMMRTVHDVIFSSCPEGLRI